MKKETNENKPSNSNSKTDWWRLANQIWFVGKVIESAPGWAEKVIHWIETISNTMM